MRPKKAIALALVTGIWAAAAEGVGGASPDLTHIIVSTQSGKAKEAMAEATGLKKPVELTLRILETKIKRGERLWYQIQVKNVGEHEIQVMDRFLFNPFRLQSNLTDSGQHIYLVLQGPDGEKLPLAWLGRDVASYVPVDPKDPYVALVKEHARRSGKEDELSMAALQSKLGKYEPIVVPWMNLPPGKSIESLPWAFNPYLTWGGAPNKGPGERKPRGDFAELPFFELEDSGRYRIKAVYDEIPPALDDLPPDVPEEALPELRAFFNDPKARAEKEGFGAVFVETPWIEIQVGE